MRFGVSLILAFGLAAAATVSAQAETVRSDIASSTVSLAFDDLAPVGSLLSIAEQGLDVAHGGGAVGNDLTPSRSAPEPAGAVLAFLAGLAVVWFAVDERRKRAMPAMSDQ